ncbi:hypothetical protein [Aquipseudomonas guryensis]|jgi:hypothetical protein|uniref:Uncharacterized protein n=1 Tax=Aquipseudomonas guryensis TaxID=2759165 RepID=A0A7W4D998_9GAMM|nr:hypothetical protein [Pseudomonas guryensis]MBB1518354.1 hypothetical protein [Pseudomonas guryensis]
MQISAQQALLLAVFLTLSNAPALAGNGKVVGGGIARTIECNQTLARNLELDEQLKRLPGNPPDKRREALASTFDLSGLDCQAA